MGKANYSDDFKRDELEEKWRKYPIVLKSWREKWPNLSVYFKYPADIRKVIYTTNTPSCLMIELASEQY